MAETTTEPTAREPLDLDDLQRRMREAANDVDFGRLEDHAYQLIAEVERLRLDVAAEHAAADEAEVKTSPSGDTDA